MYTSKLFESYNQQLNEKINKDNIEINKAIANPNLGRNQDRIKQAGYDVDFDGGMVSNPKTGKHVYPTSYDREKRKKVDFKGKLDSERKPTSKTRRFMSDIKDNKIPKSAKLTKDEYNSDEVEYYSPRYNNDPKKSISSNMNYYKKAVKDRDEARFSADRNKKGLSYYEKKVKDAQKDLDWQKDYIKDKEKEADWAESKRKAIIDNIRKRKTESEELNEDYSESSITTLGYEVDEHLTDAYNLLLAYLQDKNNTEKRNEINSFIDRLEELMNSINEELLNESIKVESEDLDESIELTEDYSEKLGGEPEDFISDMKSLLYQLKTIETENFGTHLAKQIVYDFEETVQNQINMISSRYNLEETEKLNESSAYNTKSKEEFESIEDFKDAVNDDIDTIVNNLEDLKSRMNTDDAVEILETSKGMINSTLLDRAYN